MYFFLLHSWHLTLQHQTNLHLIQKRGRLANSGDVNASLQIYFFVDVLDRTLPLQLKYTGVTLL
jgi:hypothetical protein